MQLVNDTRGLVKVIQSENDKKETGMNDVKSRGKDGNGIHQPSLICVFLPICVNLASINDFFHNFVLHIKI